MTIEPFWQSVPGFFTWPGWCAEIAWGHLPANARIVEVGCHAGQSAACLGVELMRWSWLAGAKLDLVDLFGWGVSPEQVRATLAPIAPVLGEIRQGDSAATAALYVDSSLDMVFIDADHSYAAVARDIDAWLPKVKPGGIIAGHDFCLEFPGVIQAVTERFEEFEIHRGIDWGGNAPMHGKYYPVWWTRRQ